MARKHDRIYFDYAASTPMAPQVFRAMRPYFSDKYGNPGSLHSFGQEAQAAIDRSREVVARALGAKFREVIFTGSATEANNLALRGALSTKVYRLIVSAVEHESILETAKILKKKGVEVLELPVDGKGIVKLDALAKALDGQPALVSVMYANNETGAIQPIASISKIVHEAGGLLHTDAAQAFQFLDCRPSILGADMLTISAHKIYGPKGIGALYVRQSLRLGPVVTGGGQEFGLRSGTENVPLVAGFAAAVEYIEEEKEKQARRIGGLKKELISGIKKIHPKAALNGPADGLPHIMNVWLPGVPAQDLLIRLDLAGVAVSAGSACTARSSQPSHVLRAMGLSEKRAKESVRVSLGRPTSPAEIASFFKVLGSF
jgi:cysteine desulfurase